MALSNLTKVQTVGIGSNIEVVGVVTTGQFKSGTSNLHSTGVELTNLNVSGIATIGGNLSIGGTLTYEDVTNIDSIGIITARAGVNVSGGQLDVGSNIKLGNAGVITATTFVGNLTGTASQVTIANGADNRVLTAASANTLNGESTLTYDGTNLDLGDGKYVRLGAGNDFQMWHNGGTGNTNIKQVTGHMYFYTGSDLNMLIRDGTSVDLYYANSKKLETTSTGAKITGNLSFNSAGQGIDFSASAHASGMASELLDDYERGSWTPQFYNARTGGTQLTNPSNTQANYVKVGRIVYLHLGVHGLTKNWAGSGTQIFIRGIPYRSYFQHNGHCVRVGYFGGGSMGNDDMNVYANLRQYDTYMELQKSGGAQGRYEALNWEDIHWEGYGNLTCEMVYETDQGV